MHPEMNGPEVRGARGAGGVYGRTERHIADSVSLHNARCPPEKHGVPGNFDFIVVHLAN